MTIRKSIWVEGSQEISFRAFCEEIGQWWPKGPSFGGKDLKDMIIEGRVGGRIREIYADNSEYEIGRVTSYQPPAVVAFTWRAPSWDKTTQVEVRFNPERNGTRIELEHSGWEHDEKLRDGRKSYDGGWEMILGIYQKHAASAV